MASVVLCGGLGHKQLYLLVSGNDACSLEEGQSRYSHRMGGRQVEKARLRGTPSCQCRLHLRRCSLPGDLEPELQPQQSCSLQSSPRGGLHPGLLGCHLPPWGSHSLPPGSALCDSGEWVSQGSSGVSPALVTGSPGCPLLRRQCHLLHGEAAFLVL